MTDERLRELEQRFRETSLVEDEAAMLRERARSDEEQAMLVAVAAFSGHEASCIALDHERLLHNRVEDWEEEALSLHPVTAARGATAAVFGYFEVFTTTATVVMPENIARIFARSMVIIGEAIQAWESSGELSAEIRGALQEECLLTRDRMGITHNQPLGITPRRLGNSHTLGMLLNILVAMLSGGQQNHYTRAIQEAGRYLQLTGFHGALTIELRDLLDASLLPWALGEYDPLDQMLEQLRAAADD